MVLVCKWSSHNEYSTNIAITNNFVAWKHGHVVAAVLPRAQLCNSSNEWIGYTHSWGKWLMHAEH